MVKTETSTPDEEIPTLDPDSMTKPQKDIPISAIVEYRNKGLTYREIGELLGCTKQNIHERLQPFIASIDTLPAVKGTRADVLAVVSDGILNSLTTEDIKKSSAYQKVGMYALLYDKERLERGESTQNVAHAHVSRDLQEILTELRNRGLNPA